MASEPQPNDAEVPRAPGYVRFHADGAMAFPLGRDIEIVFMENSPRLFEHNEEDPHSTVQNSGYNADLRRLIAGHVRLTGGAAISLAFDILEEASEMKPVRKDKVIEQLRQMLASYLSSEGND